jgi:phosphohistidine phosphatase
LKSLFAMRHAKSDWSQSVDDFDRPLNRRGRGDPPRVGQMLEAIAGGPDLVVSSPAERARETANGVVQALGRPVDILFRDRLYLAGTDAITQALHSAGKDATGTEAESVLLIGHNPGLEEWIARLCGARVRLPTAAVAHLLVSVDDWSEVGTDCGQLQWLVIPKLITAIRAP